MYLTLPRPRLPLMTFIHFHQLRKLHKPLNKLQENELFTNKLMIGLYSKSNRNYQFLSKVSFIFDYLLILNGFLMWLSCQVFFRERNANRLSYLMSFLFNCLFNEFDQFFNERERDDNFFLTIICWIEKDTFDIYYSAFCLFDVGIFDLLVILREIRQRLWRIVMS